MPCFGGINANVEKGFCSLEKVYGVLCSCSRAADYQRLQEITKDMVQSPFSYHVARLKTLQESQTVY